jgi:hypothetical protein
MTGRIGERLRVLENNVPVKPEQFPRLFFAPLSRLDRYLLSRPRNPKAGPHLTISFVEPREEQGLIDMF